MADIVPSTLAKWVPFDNKGTTPLRHDIVCVHTMVGTLAGSWNWANGAGRAYWHFGLHGNGELWQCHDLRYRSASNLEGNPYVIPIECADMGSPFSAWSGQCGDVPAWTGAQVDKLIALISWLCVRYNIPPSIVPDTQAGRRGLAYHRQGVPNSPEWKTGNLKWSTSTGKCCPDWRRIEQFKTKVVPAVRARVLGEDMPLTEDDIKKIDAMIDAKAETFKEWVRLGVNAASRDDSASTLGGQLDTLLAVDVAEEVADSVAKKLNVYGPAGKSMRARAKEGALDALVEAGLYVPPVPPEA